VSRNLRALKSIELALIVAPDPVDRRKLQYVRRACSKRQDGMLSALLRANG
jgi:hypothetical protein